MADCNKREVKAKSDLDSVVDTVKQEEKEQKNTMKSIETTETLISSKSEVNTNRNTYTIYIYLYRNTYTIYILISLIGFVQNYFWMSSISL